MTRVSQTTQSRSEVENYCAVHLHFISMSNMNSLLSVHGSYHSLSLRCNDMIKGCHSLVFTYSCTFANMKLCTITHFIVWLLTAYEVQVTCYDSAERQF